MVYVSLTQSHWRHLLSRKSNERKLVSEVPTLGAMYLGNSVSIVRICCLSVAYVIILNSLYHEKNVRTVANTKGWAETFLQQYCIFDQSGDSPLSALLFCQFAGFLYLLSLFWFAVVEWIPDWKWRRSFSQGNATFAYGRWKIVKKSGEYNCWTCSITSTLFYRPKFILPSLMVVPCIFSNDAKLVVIGKMCWSYLPKRMPNFQWPA